MIIGALGVRPILYIEFRLKLQIKSGPFKYPPFLAYSTPGTYVYSFIEYSLSTRPNTESAKLGNFNDKTQFAKQTHLTFYSPNDKYGLQE